MNLNSGRGQPLAPTIAASLAPALVALAGILTAGCSTPCDDAADHLAECGYDDGDRYSDDACDDKIECSSKCVMQATCGTFDGSDPNATAAYKECLSKC